MDVDPALIDLDTRIKQARVKPAEAEGAAEENWATVNEELTASLIDLLSFLEGDGD